MWLNIDYTEKEIEIFTKNRELKDKVIGKNLFESKTRWVGDLAEDGVARVFDQNGIKYIHWTNEREKDLRDFTVGKFEIDVKCLVVNYYPKENYGVNVAKVQTFNKIVNTYIFTHFVLPFRKLVIIGWKSKDEFMEDARELPKGYKLTDSFTTPCDMFEVLCYQVRSLESLFDLTKG